ncbi:hypothetical protein DVH05_015712 [Phytophthora capsici]|nr:hypothetical protein DVH05_015712 [Phytophthora capsici]
MGVPARPMPSKPVCDTFDKLRQDAVGLLSLRKHLKSKQNEAQALRERYEHTNGQEYKSITTPGTLSDRPGDAALADGGRSNSCTGNQQGYAVCVPRHLYYIVCSTNELFCGYGNAMGPTI